MNSKTDLKTIGVWSFIAGVVLALIIGVATVLMKLDMNTMGLVSGFMVLLGLVVGALNVTEKEVNSFIIAAIGLSVGSTALAALGTILTATVATQWIGTLLQTTFMVFGTFIAGAVFIPALKSVYSLSRD